MPISDDVTLGELHRRLSGVEADLRRMQLTLIEIKTALASQGVKVGVVWAGLGVGSSGLIVALTGLVTRAG